jgi:8-oxo-dGTP pyrophosphatase MutT (NUDIX family)
MKKGKIRPLALCIFRRGDMIFVAEGLDKVKQAPFYRPLGGGIDFGEYASDTIKRELMEEIKAEVTDIRYLGTFENIFSYEGESGHEICLVFDGRFVEEARNQDDYSVIGEDDGDVLFTASWKAVSWFLAGNAPLYPDGLPEFLGKLIKDEAKA